MSYETFETEFMSLDDDCIFEIFDRLSFKDLCTISQTCKHLQNLAGKHFQQKNATENMTISKGGDTEFPGCSMFMAEPKLHEILQTIYSTCDHYVTVTWYEKYGSFYT